MLILAALSLDAPSRPFAADEDIPKGVICKRQADEVNAGAVAFIRLPLDATKADRDPVADQLLFCGPGLSKRVSIAFVPDGSIMKLSQVSVPNATTGEARRFDMGTWRCGQPLKMIFETTIDVDMKNGAFTIRKPISW